ncbi:hypothetical protein ACFLZK_00225 [Patescibacteria group bacterium]
MAQDLFEVVISLLFILVGGFSLSLAVEARKKAKELRSGYFFEHLHIFIITVVISIGFLVLGVVSIASLVFNYFNFRGL